MFCAHKGTGKDIWWPLQLLFHTLYTYVQANLSGTNCNVINKHIYEITIDFYRNFVSLFISDNSLPHDVAPDV